MTVVVALAMNALIATAKLIVGAVSGSSSMLAARLDLADGLDSNAVEDVSSRIERQIGRRHPDVTQVFLDATRASAPQRHRARRLVREQ